MAQKLWPGGSGLASGGRASRPAGPEARPPLIARAAQTLPSFSAAPKIGAEISAEYFLIVNRGTRAAGWTLSDRAKLPHVDLQFGDGAAESVAMHS